MRFTSAFVPVVVALASTLATPARADTPGRKGDVVFSADRLMGLYFYKDGADDATLFGLGISPLGARPYTTARLGIDFFPARNLSLGGSIAYWSEDRDPGGSWHGFLISPRIGYTLDIGGSFGFWPRGGFTYRSIGGGDNSDDEFALTFEGLFYASPASHFAFTFGPAIDIGIAGDASEARSFGVVTFGILGWI